jgi:large subunit ribosomal protein L3
MGHGSQYHRGVGSLGTLLPMHVLKGKKLPGHMGNAATTIQNLEVVSVDLENNVILIKGNVPGPKKSLVMIRTSVKKGDKANQAIELVSYEVEEEKPVEVEATEEVVEETPAEETTEENVGE